MREQRDAMRQLLKSAGWEVVSQILDRWISENQAQVQPVLNLEQACERNLHIGENRGYIAARNLPQTLLDSLNAAIESATQQETTDDDYREGHPSDE